MSSPDRLSTEIELRVAVDHAYVLARHEVFDLGLRAGDVGLSRRQQDLLAHLELAEHELTLYRRRPL